MSVVSCLSSIALPAGQTNSRHFVATVYLFPYLEKNSNQGQKTTNVRSGANYTNRYTGLPPLPVVESGHSCEATHHFDNHLAKYHTNGKDEGPAKCGLHQIKVKTEINILNPGVLIFRSRVFVENLVLKDGKR